MSLTVTQKRQSVNVMMCGPWGAGKTSIVYVMKHGRSAETSPTIGVDFEHLLIGTTVLRAWEVGGRERFRSLSEGYYRNAKAFIFVVDSNDRHGIDQAYRELSQMRIEERFKDKPVLILANKQDLPDAISVEELKNKLALNEFDDKIIWHLQATSAIQNQGIHEGFEWLANKFVTVVDVMKPIQETVDDAVAVKNSVLSMFNLNNWKHIFSKFFDF